SGGRSRRLGLSALPSELSPTDHGAMQLDRSGLEILSRDDCLARLESAAIGRIAVTVDALPVVLPVNFVVSDGCVVISTAPGTKLHAATRRSVVAFEVDAIDPLYHAGWSVLVTGTAEEIVDPVELGRARRLPLRAWGLGGSADIH